MCYGIEARFRGLRTKKVKSVTNNGCKKSERGGMGERWGGRSNNFQRAPHLIYLARLREALNRI